MNNVLRYETPFSEKNLKNNTRKYREVNIIKPLDSKLVDSIEDAIIKSGLKDGMTISFHHHFREGDYVIGYVLEAIRKLGIKDLTFAPSAVVNLNNVDFVSYIKDGTIRSVQASGIRGELGNYILREGLKGPVILRPHGSRPRAIESGELNIDVAFIGASSADDYGNATGAVGKNACGTLSYSVVDSKEARKVVVITDNLVEYPCSPIAISEDNVDYVVKVDEIGDPEKIAKGAARLSRKPLDLKIAKSVVDLIKNSGYFKEGFSFQTGAGAIAIACTKYLRDAMEESNIKAKFALGGVTGMISDMLNDGLVEKVLAAQSFDAEAAKALSDNPNMIEIDTSFYANPHNKGCAVNKLDIGILGALEVDLDFNVNILVGSNGKMLSGIGGGPDVAAGAEVSIIAVPITRKRTPSIVDEVFTICTPGETVAAVVTEAGTALNPKHRNYEFLKNNLEKSNIKLYTIEKLRDIAYKITGKPDEIKTKNKEVAVVQYRDGSIIDTINQIDFDYVKSLSDWES
ncbi:Citrate lyase alpha chain [Peptoniphilus sp. ING2-D1G]|nr:Citrate lyase alpha chain [Peptoniphilus sp. ING2-D1G]